MSASGLSTSTMRSSAASSRGELGRAVGRGREGEDQLGRARDILREHGLDGAPQVRPLVQHRHDEASRRRLSATTGASLRPGWSTCTRRSCHAGPVGILKAWVWSRMRRRPTALLRKAVGSRAAVGEVRRTARGAAAASAAPLPRRGLLRRRRREHVPDAPVVQAARRARQDLARRRAQPRRDRCARAAGRGRAAGRVRADRARPRALHRRRRTSASCCTSTRTRATSRCSATDAAGTCSSTTASPTRCT